MPPFSLPSPGLHSLKARRPPAHLAGLPRVQTPLRETGAGRGPNATPPPRDPRSAGGGGRRALPSAPPASPGRPSRPLKRAGTNRRAASGRTGRGRLGAGPGPGGAGAGGAGLRQTGAAGVGLLPFPPATAAEALPGRRGGGAEAPRQLLLFDWAGPGAVSLGSAVSVRPASS